MDGGRRLGRRGYRCGMGCEVVDPISLLVLPHFCLTSVHGPVSGFPLHLWFILLLSSSPSGSHHEHFVCMHYTSSPSTYASSSCTPRCASCTVLAPCFIHPHLLIRVSDLYLLTNYLRILRYTHPPLAIPLYSFISAMLRLEPCVC